MKVLRYRIRVISLVVCAVAGVVGGTGLPSPLRIGTTSAFTPTATVATSSELTGKQSPKEDFKLQACPPATTIHGTLGSGSADYPFVSGLQTGRITNGLGNIACGSANPCSLKNYELEACALEDT